MRRTLQLYKDDTLLHGRFGAVGERCDVPAMCFGQLVELVDVADDRGEVGRSFSALREIRRRNRRVDGASGGT